MVYYGSCATMRKYTDSDIASLSVCIEKLKKHIYFQQLNARPIIKVLNWCTRPNEMTARETYVSLHPIVFCLTQLRDNRSVTWGCVFPKVDSVLTFCRRPLLYLPGILCGHHHRGLTFLGVNAA